MKITLLLSLYRLQFHDQLVIMSAGMCMYDRCNLLLSNGHGLKSRMKEFPFIDEVNFRRTAELHEFLFDCSAYARNINIGRG